MPKHIPFLAHRCINFFGAECFTSFANGVIEGNIVTGSRSNVIDEVEVARCPFALRLLSKMLDRCGYSVIAVVNDRMIAR